ncbi:unnamed protein product [Nezara viridula]|uniref:Uncharacterized protein n=1 Tax=Nezara viridula TaxID=85310 RepID=A0A9P0HKY3_NEZVI|nr:unnamed protein product [Nezara viridula]
MGGTSEPSAVQLSHTMANNLTVAAGLSVCQEEGAGREISRAKKANKDGIIHIRCARGWYAAERPWARQQEYDQSDVSQTISERVQPISVHYFSQLLS